MDRLYEKYLSDHAGEEDTEAVAAFINKYVLDAAPVTARTFLDLGCGQGGVSAFLRRKGLVSVGIDISPEQVEKAHQLGRDYIIEGSVDAFLTASNQTWDVITAFDFLEHLQKDAVLPTLEMAAVALRQGGMLIARTPNGAGPLFGRIQFGDFTHQSVFTVGSMRQLANSAGFTRAEFVEVPPNVHGLKSALRRGIWSVFSGVTRLAMAAESGRVRGHFVTSNVVAYLYK